MHLQQAMLRLTEENVTPLILLKTMFQTECAPLQGVPTHINNSLGRFCRRNIWHGVTPNSFSTWVLTNIEKKIGLLNLVLFVL